MKKLVVDCSKNSGKQETILDMTTEEIAATNKRAAENALPKPHTIEDRLTALEESVRAIINQGVK